MDNVQKSISLWKDAGFGDLQKLLDEQGLQISENSTAGVSSRKELSSKTKIFRKLEDQEKLSEIKPLLRLYQQEIDNLTTRAKFSESCFMSLYKQIGDLPDPMPLFELVQTSASEISQLRKRNAQLEKEAESRKDYSELKLKLEQAEKRATQKETELKAYYDEKQRSATRREADLTKQLEEVKAELSVANARLEDADSTAPSEVNLKLAQAQSLAQDLQRAQTRAKQAEQRNEELRKELATAASAPSSDEHTKLERENLKLASRCDELQKELNNKHTEYNEDVERKQKLISQLEAKVGSAQSQLAKQSDYEQIRKELTFLRSVEFGDNEIAGDSDALDLLQTKNNKLAEDIKNIRLQKQKLENENDGLRQSLDQLRDQVQKKTTLVQQLEEDLSAVSRADDTFSTISGWTAIPRRVSPASSIRGAPRSSGAPGTPQPANDVLNIITQQRDRFKEKSFELEEDLHRCKNAVTSLRKDNETLRSENQQLFEKLRSRQKDSKGVYEDEINSFQQFKSLETERLSAGLNSADRAIYSVFERALLDSKFRYGISGYAVALHVLLIYMAL